MNNKLFGERIRAARERLGMTQETLAERLGKDQRAISEYENGKRRLSAADLPTLARALEVSLFYLFEGEVNAQDFDAALLQEFNRLPTTEAKEAALALMKLFSNAILNHRPD